MRFRIIVYLFSSGNLSIFSRGYISLYTFANLFFSHSFNYLMLRTTHSLHLKKTTFYNPVGQKNKKKLILMNFNADGGEKSYQMWSAEFNTFLHTFSIESIRFCPMEHPCLDQFCGTGRNAPLHLQMGPCTASCLSIVEQKRFFNP